MNKWIRLATVSFGGIVFSIVALILIQSMAGMSAKQYSNDSNPHQPDASQQQISYTPGHSTGAGQNYGYPMAYGQPATPYVDYSNLYAGYTPGHTTGVAQNYGYPVFYPQPGAANAYYGSPYPGYPTFNYPTGAYGNTPQSYQLQIQQQQLLQLKQQLLEMKTQLNNMNPGGVSGSPMMPM